MNSADQETPYLKGRNSTWNSTNQEKPHADSLRLRRGLWTAFSGPTFALLRIGTPTLTRAQEQGIFHHLHSFESFTKTNPAE